MQVWLNVNCQKNLTRATLEYLLELNQCEIIGAQQRLLIRLTFIRNHLVSCMKLNLLTKIPNKPLHKDAARAASVSRDVGPRRDEAGTLPSNTPDSFSESSARSFIQ